jgi:putative membrane protein
MAGRTLGTFAVLVVLVAVGASAGVMAAHSATKVPAFDEQYLMSAIQGDRFEVAGGKLARKKGKSAIVRALGTRLESDHAQSLREALALARRLKVKVPKKPTPPEGWEIRMVSTLSGAKFDRWYSDLEVADHKQDITEASDERSKGKNSQVRASAAKELPTLRQHLALSRAAFRLTAK